MSSSLRPVPKVAGTEAYNGPRTLGPIDLHLDGNEGAEPTDWLFKESREHGPELRGCYPSATALEALLATRHGVSPEQVIVTAGGDDALDRICQAFLEPGGEIILGEPGFEMIKRYAKLAGGSLISEPWAPGTRFPRDKMAAAINEKTSLFTIISPKNPTGATASAEDLHYLTALAPKALLLIDLAYIEFANEDLTQTVLSLPNAVAVRTVSKAWGLTGLRVGYALGSAELIGWLRSAGAPHSVSAPSLAMAEARLEKEDDEQSLFVARIKSERRELEEELRGLGAEPFRSQGNFVLARFHNAPWIRDALAGLGIAVRIFPERPALKNMLRITCPGNRTDFNRLIRAFHSILSPTALLLDMDGVLADVSESYRRVIIETAKSYAVDLDPSEIKAAKAIGNANDDWVLTHRLLKNHGIEESLEDVTARFEDLYQGTEEKPGLRLTETLTCERNLLTKLARTVVMAIVTGRPRFDAERFLTEKQIFDPFAHLVCMEDAPSKPDPAPVRLALEKLGVNSAWMVGDTPDDIRAARAAGVVPLGIIAPGDDPEEATDILLRAGAARVFETLDELRELLP
jgi:histidinol-phosphate aminotransferase